MPISAPMVDTHCHLNFDAYDQDLTQVLDEARHQQVTRFLIPAVDLETSRSGLRLAEQHTGVSAAIGVHPNSTATFGESLLNELRALSAHPCVVGIGEIGLDYYWDKSPKQAQWAAFEAQLRLAAELALPVIIHNRDAHEDTIAILERWVVDLPPALRGHAGVMHSFSAPTPIAERALACGFFIGFSGPITFKKADELRRVAASVPPERLLVETDAPYLTPEPRRGQRNSPAYIPHIVERLASVHRLDDDEMARQTTLNAERLFRLPT
ncbi:MAG: TatD family hydrolase [Anaerolineae bacterium]|nr:TatD family hydrolase [Anaerolineae bacterium]MDW8173205.1 TatD family hydrolase [Anaerolineae bacterium]